MSEAEVELVWSGIKVFQEQGLDAWLEQFVAHDTVFIQTLSVGPEAQTWHGHDGWRAAVAAWSDEFDDWQLEFHDVLDAGDGLVVLVFSDRGRGKRSGIWVQRPKAGFIYTLREGKIVHSVQYGLAEEALEAAGLGGD